MNDAPIQRARPLLGTVVSVGMQGLPWTEANELIELGFTAIERVHRLMSFHEQGSDVSRLNREAALHPVLVDPSTFHVLRRAISFAAASQGAFDITVAALLAQYGFLPRPAGACEPDAAASWRDIELNRDGSVRFHRPLWIDLGGIAKGYAVDQAIECMPSPPGVQTCVNAGGDLRVRGPAAQLVWLNRATPDALPAVRLQDGSLASSCGRALRRTHGRGWVGPHLDGVCRRATATRSFVSVLAPHCIVADACTKIVLAHGARSEDLLRRFGASAYLHHEGTGWRALAAPA